MGAELFFIRSGDGSIPHYGIGCVIRTGGDDNSDYGCNVWVEWHRDIRANVTAPTQTQKAKGKEKGDQKIKNRLDQFKSINDRPVLNSL